MAVSEVEVEVEVEVLEAEVEDVEEASLNTRGLISAHRV